MDLCGSTSKFGILSSNIKKNKTGCQQVNLSTKNHAIFSHKRRFRVDPGLNYEFILILTQNRKIGCQQLFFYMINAKNCLATNRKNQLLLSNLIFANKVQLPQARLSSCLKRVFNTNFNEAGNMMNDETSRTSKGGDRKRSHLLAWRPRWTALVGPRPGWSGSRPARPKTTASNSSSLTPAIGSLPCRLFQSAQIRLSQQ